MDLPGCPYNLHFLSGISMIKYLILCVVALIGATETYAQHAAIIANPANAVSSLSAREIEEILLGKKKQWSGGQVVNLAILKSGPAHDEVMKEYAKKNGAQFKSHWRNQVFSGNGIMPREFDSSDEMKAYIAATPNGFGYIDAASLDASVKQIEITQ